MAKELIGSDASTEETVIDFFDFLDALGGGVSKSVGSAAKKKLTEIERERLKFVNACNEAIKQLSDESSVADLGKMWAKAAAGSLKITFKNGVRVMRLKPECDFVIVDSKPNAVLLFKSAIAACEARRIDTELLRTMKPKKVKA